MAKLVWDDIGSVVIQAKQGEELSPELVAAWGQAQTARELMNIGHWIEEIRDSLDRLRPK